MPRPSPLDSLLPPGYRTADFGPMFEAELAGLIDIRRSDKLVVDTNISPRCIFVPIQMHQSEVHMICRIATPTHLAIVLPHFDWTTLSFDREWTMHVLDKESGNIYEVEEVIWRAPNSPFKGMAAGGRSSLKKSRHGSTVST